MEIQINLNRANETDLQTIIHIGKKRALKIIENRPFKDIYELSNIRGLGRSRMDDIIKQGYLTV